MATMNKKLKTVASHGRGGMGQEIPLRASTPRKYISRQSKSTIYPCFYLVTNYSRCCEGLVMNSTLTLLIDPLP